MDKFISPFKNGKLLNVIFLSNIFLSFHYYLIVYINSTFLSGFFSDTQVSTLYVIGSVLNIILFVNVSKLFNTLGNYKLTIYATLIEILATLGLILASNPFLIGLYFIIHITTVAFLGLNLDVFLESLIKDEEKTGGIRSMFMTLSNATLVVAPLVIAVFLVGNVYWHIYFISMLFLLPMFYLLRKYFKNSETKQFEYIKIRVTLKKYLTDKNLYNIFTAQFMLQLFYAFMVVYTPLYLEKYVGFSWSEIGIIFTIMLLPFVLFEIPVGDLADKKYGEKEFMTVGFIVMGLFTMLISFIDSKNFMLWVIVLFLTRVGASLVEVTSDSYFFKKVDEEKTDVISFYRLTRPLSYVVAPIIAALALQFVPFQFTFIIIGALMIVGTRYSLALVDTK
jgi:MFS family permease